MFLIDGDELVGHIEFFRPVDIGTPWGLSCLLYDNVYRPWLEG